MQFKPLIDAIEAQIKADSAANALISVYNRYSILPGIHTMPVVITGTSHNAKLEEEYLGESLDSRPRLWEARIGISVLTRRYPLQKQVIKASENIDAVQHAISAALSSDATLGDVVVQSWIENVREVSYLNNEYWGFELVLVAQVFETST